MTTQSIAPSTNAATHHPPPAPQAGRGGGGGGQAVSMDEALEAVKQIKICSECGRALTGQFVRALNKMYHLDCFRCLDCGKNVAAKFFPYDSPAHGAVVPLCERDYFRRIDLLCAKCGEALRGAYVQALNKKYHVDHFTCSACPTRFGPSESYYEHDGKVFCHYHYSALHATLCRGCMNAILRQFAEINRNGQVEQWHPECYMIYKSWNIRLSFLPDASCDDPSQRHSLQTAERERVRTLNPSQLRNEQSFMEEQVSSIWTVLSAFEESSAACISRMLIHVSNGANVEGVTEAATFIAHVEVLFRGIDQIERALEKVGDSTGMQHNKEPQILAKRIVSFFSLVSTTQESGTGGCRRSGVTQDLLSLVTNLAHLLKMLIRIALNGALKLERKYRCTTAISILLETLMVLDDKATGNDALDTAASQGLEGKTVNSLEDITQLEQYVILLREALKRLKSLLRVDVDDEVISTAANPAPPAASAMTPPINGHNTPPDRVSRPSSASSTQPRWTSGRGAGAMTGAGGGDIKQQLLMKHKDLQLREGVSEQRETDREREDECSGVPEAGDRLEGSGPSGLSVVSAGTGATSGNFDNSLSTTPSSRGVFPTHRVGGPPFSPATGVQAQSIPQIPNALIPTATVPVRTNSRPSPNPGPAPTNTASLSRQPALSVLSALELFIVRHLAVIQLATLLRRPTEELIDCIETRKQSVWSKLVSSLKTNKRQKPKAGGTFAVPLEELVAARGVETKLGPSPATGTSRIPLFVEDLIQAMKKKDLNLEGIFRRPGNIKKVNKTQEALDRDPASVSFEDEDVIQCAALLKRFLLSLPDSLFTSKLYPMFIESQRLPDISMRVHAVHLLICLLPAPNRDLVEVLFTFLRECSTYAQMDNSTAGNKMNVRNLATVMAPNVMHCKNVKEPPSREEMELAIDAFEVVMMHVESFHNVPSEIASAMANLGAIQPSMQANINALSAKEVLKTCETLINMKPTPTYPVHTYGGAEIAGAERVGSKAVIEG